MSHPSRVRGLKYYLRHDAEVLHTVAPFTGAWIEIPCHQRIDLARRLSHPSRVRGLKWAVIDKACQDGKSHPSRVRGLKSIPFVAVGIARMVAPFTGAWIEMWTRG